MYSVKATQQTKHVYLFLQSPEASNEGARSPSRPVETAINREGAELVDLIPSQNWVTSDHFTHHLVNASEAASPRAAALCTVSTARKLDSVASDGRPRVMWRRGCSSRSPTRESPDRSLQCHLRHRLKQRKVRTKASASSGLRRRQTRWDCDDGRMRVRAATRTRPQ